MNSGKKSLLKHWDFILLDLITLMVSYLLANVIRFRIIEQKEIVFGSLYRQQSLILICCLLVSLFSSEPYKNVLKRGRMFEVRAVFKHTLFMAAVNVIAAYFVHIGGSLQRSVVIITWVVYFVLQLFLRIVYKRILQKRMQNSKSKLSMLVFTTGNIVTEVLNSLKENPFPAYSITGLFLTDYDRVMEIINEGYTNNKTYPNVTLNEQHQVCLHGVPLLGGPNDIVEYASHHWVDEVFIGIPGHKDEVDDFVKQFGTMGIETHRVLMQLTRKDDGNSAEKIERIGKYVVSTKAVRDVSAVQIFLKRLLDIVGGIVGCVLTGILFLFVAPAIYIKSPGPIFFSQKRVGKNGKVFKMYKFRSMYLDAEERKAELMAQNKVKDGLMFKMDDDPRIIGSEKKDKNGKPKGIGNFIRKTSIDEFPQFFNVLKNDMSLVGTRPPTIDEWKKYSPEHRARLSMKPGITGLWQISGRSDITDFEKVVKLDAEYINTWTVQLDMKILARTVTQVLKHKGAS